MSQFLLSARATAIVARVAAHYGYEVLELVQPYRGADVVRARSVAMYALRHGLQMSYPQIGKFFHRDHTTVIAAVIKIEADHGAKMVAERLIKAAFPAEAPKPAGLVTDQGLRQFLGELDRKVEQARELRTLLTGKKPLEVAS